MNDTQRLGRRLVSVMGGLMIVGLVSGTSVAQADELPPPPVAPGASNIVIGPRPLSDPAKPAPVAKKTPAKPVAKKAPAKPVAKKAPAKPVVKKAPAKKQVVKKAAMKKAAVKKAAATKSAKRTVRR